MRLNALAALFAISALVGCDRALPSKFDLECGVTEDVFTDGKASTSSKATHAFRINLDDMEWCRGACISIFKVKRVEPGQIVLSEFEKGSGLQLIIDRVSGDIAEDSFNEFFGTSSIGSCERKPFSGMPKRKF